MSTENTDRVSRRRFVAGVASGAALLPTAAGAAQGAGSDSSSGYPRAFDGPNLSLVAFPLGGIGTGTISLGGRGQLRDWEIFNRPDKGNSPQYSFFSVRAAGDGVDARILESRIQPPYEVASSYRGLGFFNVPGLPRFEGARFEGDYPFARVEFLDGKFPAKIQLEAFNPLVPHDVEASSLPVAVFRYTVGNPTAKPLTISLAYSQENPVGQKGHGCEIRNSGALSGLYFTDPFAAADVPNQGSFAVGLLPNGGAITYLRSWKGTFSRDWPLHFWEDFKSDGALSDTTRVGPSRIASLCVKKEIPAGGSASFTFILAWRFPNRTPRRCGWRPADGHANDVIGNAYCQRFASAWEAAESAAADLESLESKSRAFVDLMHSGSLPPAVVDAAVSNISTLRTNTCFQTADGNFYGFEGCRNDAGCCFGNCNHVWNYEQATGFLFPSLARNMRESEFGPAINEEGCISFRQLLPPGVDRTNVAATDGQMGTLMRLYREWQLSGDTDWLRRIWPAAKTALSFAWIENGWDGDQDGVMEGVQHNTYDVEFFGPNPLCTVLYLGALRAGEEMARAAGDDAFADRCRRLFESGSKWVDENLFDGEYYVQQVRPIPIERIPASLAIGNVARHRPESPVHQVANGCLIDQLLGQYAAHVFGLGYLLDEEKVRTTLRSIMRYNYRETLAEHDSVQRAFALNDEAAVLMCSYPKGEKPAFPFWFSQEVWTGSEYQLAAHMFYEGLYDEALTIVESVRNRYDGLRRNPWNEAECGHHYARAMASWALVTAVSGFRFSAVSQSIGFHPPRNREAFRSFWSTGTAWGGYSQKQADNAWQAELDLSHGTLNLREMDIDLDTVPGGAKASVTLSGKAVEAAIRQDDGKPKIAFGGSQRLEAGQSLKISIA